jgi:hypothetical protein
VALLAVLGWLATTGARAVYPGAGATPDPLVAMRAPLGGGGCVQFTNVPDVVAGALPAATQALVVADFDGDGKPDVVATSDRNSVSFFPGDGDGTFGSERRYPAGSRPTARAAAHVDGDDDHDRVTLDTRDNPG